MGCYGSLTTIVLSVAVGAYILVLIRRAPELMLAIRRLWRSCDRMLAARKARWARHDSLEFDVTGSQRERGRLVEEKARELADARQIGRCKLAARVGLHVPAVALIFMLHGRLFHGQGEDTRLDHTIYRAVLVQVCLIIVDFFSDLNIQRCKIRACHLDVLYVVLMATFASMAVIPEDIFALHRTTLSSLPTRLLLGLACTRMPLALAMNLAYVLMSVMCYRQLAANASPQVLEYLGPLHGYSFFLLESFLAAVSTLLVFLWRTSTVTEARAEVMMNASDQVGASLRAILSALCDAVVCVNAEGQILPDSRGLNALLMRCDEKTLAGTPFLDLVQESDRERLVLHLDASMRNSSDSPAASLHVTLRGACSSQVRVQLFNARLRDIDGRDVNLLGIQELSREEGDVLPLGHCERGQQQQPAAPPPLRWRGPSSPGTESLDSGSSVPDFVPLVEHELPGAAVWVDPLNWHIQRCNAEFAALCGPVLQDTDLRTWLGNKELTERVVQDCVQEFLQESGKRIYELGKVVLQPPLVERVKMEYHASGVLLPELGPQCADPDDAGLEDVVMVIILGSVTPCKKRSSRPRLRCGCKNSSASAENSACALFAAGEERVRDWPKVLSL